jgi:hypothetical protein
MATSNGDELQGPVKISSADIYKMTLNTRNMEINLFWQRCNYFLLLNSALAYAYVTVADKNLSLPLTVLGFIVCIFWYRVALGSKYWQEHWEAKIKEVEWLFKGDKTFPEHLKLFTSSWDESRDAVTRSMGVNDPEVKHSIFDAIVASQILSKPSVTQSMIYLVLTFCLSWVGIFLYQLYQITESIVQ